MTTVSSASSATQYGMQQLKLQQARHEADQADQTAQVLQKEAQGARRDANRANEKARTLSSEADRAQVVAGQARQSLAAMGSERQMLGQLSNTMNQVASRLGNATPSPTQTIQTNQSASQASPIVNTQGQMTGTLINTTA